MATEKDLERWAEEQTERYNRRAIFCKSQTTEKRGTSDNLNALVRSINDATNTARIVHDGNGHEWVLIDPALWTEICRKAFSC